MDEQKEIIRWYEKEEFQELEKCLGVKFADKAILIQAFIHRSFLNENPNFPLNNNERLEFLGDAALELSITEYLYKNYQNSEGELTRWRAALVNTNILSQLAVKFNFGKYLLSSKGEMATQRSNSILADTVEAFIGALYLDQGRGAVDKFIEKNIASMLTSIIDKVDYIDPKSKLQELIQSQGQSAPRYQIIKAEGPDHDKSFQVGVVIQDKVIGTGIGRSKQEAEQAAAIQALNYFKKDR